MRQLKVRDRMYDNWRLEIQENGKVSWIGVERGPLTLHAEDNQYIIVKEAGHQWYWNQYNGQKYEPAKFIVFRKFDAPATTEVEVATEFYVKPR